MARQSSWTWTGGELLVCTLSPHAREAITHAGRAGPGVERRQHGLIPRSRQLRPSQPARHVRRRIDRHHPVRVDRGAKGIQPDLASPDPGDRRRPGEGDVCFADGAAFKPGATIEISAGYAGGSTKIFQGVVVRQGLSISAKDGAVLEVECLDAMTAATGARRSATFANSTDSDVIRAVLSAHGVTAEVDATAVAYEKLVQVDCTDWDYVVARAGASGLLVSMDDGKVSVKAPRTEGEAVLKVTYGDDLIALRADQTLPVERAAGTARRFRGQARFQGTAMAKVGALLELAGVGARFGGNALITSVCHEISAGSWITEVELGALPLPASPSWPGGVPGLRLGAVRKVDADPAGQFRIQISVPLSGGENAVLWARL